MLQYILKWNLINCSSAQVRCSSTSSVNKGNTRERHKTGEILIGQERL